MRTGISEAYKNKWEFSVIVVYEGGEKEGGGGVTEGGQGQSTS